MKTVLIIESDAGIRVPIEEALRENGFEAVGAAHGAGGLATAKEYLPDLVLCAERMSGMDGYHVARLLRQDAAAGFPRFLLLTEGEYPAFPHGMTAGIDGSLRVPLAMDELIAAVRAQFEDGGRDREEPMAPPVPHMPLAGEKTSRPASEILNDLAGATHELLGMVEKFLRFTQVKVALDRRRSQTRAAASRIGGGMVHSNQVGSLARVVADAEDRAGDLNCHLEKGFLPLEMEELEVLVGELVQNACRFSQPGAPIDVFYFRQGEGSEVMVRDYGIGMTPDEIAVLRALVAAPAEETPGARARLGVTMVRMIAESRGGRFLVHSVPDVGTTVRILLPDAPPVDRSAGSASPGRVSEPGDLGVPPFDEGGGDPF